MSAPAPPGPVVPPVKRGRGRPKKTEEEKARDKAARLLAKAQGKTVPPKNKKKKTANAMEEAEVEQGEDAFYDNDEDAEVARGHTLGSKTKVRHMALPEEHDDEAMADAEAETEKTPKWFDAIYAESVAQLRKALDESPDWKEETW